MVPLVMHRICRVFVALGVIMCVAVPSAAAQGVVRAEAPPEIRTLFQDLTTAANGDAAAWEAFAQAHYTPALLSRETATERARAQGVRMLYLVTDGAQGYFGEKLGFSVVDRKDVDPAVATTAEYLLARSKTATWMRKEL